MALYTGSMFSKITFFFFLPMMLSDVSVYTKLFFCFKKICHDQQPVLFVPLDTPHANFPGRFDSLVYVRIYDL